jgi:DNA-binding ferritin-like protein (Dps family)
MKKLVKVEEVAGEGLVGLLGENVTLFCLNYIYHGKLVGVNDSFVMLENASVVYETGAFDDKAFKRAEKLPRNWYVQISAIESFGLLGK